ncbi:MAG: MAB_1171c family putative transporter [Pseudonocardiaceae bacterium]
MAGLVLLWKAWQLRRAPRDPGVWLVTGCVTAALTEYILGSPQFLAVLDSTHLGVAKLVENLSLFLLDFLLVCFFLHSAGGSSRLRFQSLIFIAASAALTAIWFAVPLPFRGTPYAATLSPSFDVVGVRLFQLLAGGYVGYLMLVALPGAWRYAHLTKPPLSHGLRIMAIGLAGKLVAVVERATANAAAWIGHPIAAPLHNAVYLLLAVSIWAFLAGLAYPSIAGRVLAAGRSWRHRQAYRRLEPLWSALDAAFPDDALHRVSRWFGADQPLPPASVG